MEDMSNLSQVEETAAQGLPEETLQTKEKKKLYGEHYLAILAGVLALITLVLTLFSLPYILAEPLEEDPEQIIHDQPPAAVPTIPEVDPQTGEKLPEPEKNPYGKLDFQYEGRYLGCIKAGTVPGIDVSYYQGQIDWKQVKQSGIDFAIIRLGYRGFESGKLVEDQYAKTNLKNAKEAGLKIGAYFFSQALNIKETDQEIQFMLKILGDTKLDMPIVLDWEIPANTARTRKMDARTLTDIQRHFCGQMRDQGYQPMIYFNWHQSENLYVLHELEDYPFWLALYQDRMTYPWKVEMWQYSDKGKVPGIQGNVDLNVYMPD